MSEERYVYQNQRHYSYECKSSTQERPYVSRPSRSQQFRNPKLVPKLTNETLNPLEKKKGVADEELAKAEAERARKLQSAIGPSLHTQFPPSPRERRDLHHLVRTGPGRPFMRDGGEALTLMQSPAQEAAAVMTVEAAAAVLARTEVEALELSLSADALCPAIVAPLRTMTAVTSTDPVILYLPSKRAALPNGQGDIHQNRKVQMGLGDNALVGRGPPSTEAGAMRGRTIPVLDMTVRERLLEEGLMGKDMMAEARLPKSSRENEV
ncbi:hypothetical protein NW762_004693 [Fusarium torreyae]|uniref:Uncharacterized protein n=1 Tax=Fusarium torreyae TaxID=1237075 RepID=A0A9W8S550_9HYPO|nr:hypothetical protein NW762_004693 [Fusarium torreyae]